MESNLNYKTETESYASGGWRSHKILIVLFIIYLSDYADRMVVSSMLGFIKRDLNITDAQAGWLVGVVVLFITVFTIPASILIDRWSRRKMVAIMTFFWSLATLACAFTKNYTQLLIARSLIGIGESGYAPGGSAMLAGAYPEESRAKVMGIWNASIPMGVGIGLAAGGLIASKYGWHHAFGLVSLPGFLLAIAAWYLPDYKTIAPQTRAVVGFQKSFFENTIEILSIPSLSLTYVAFAMNVAATTALMTWLPKYFEETGVAAEGKGGVIASGIFALVLFGAPIGGVLSDVWHRKQKRGRLLFPAVSTLISAAFLFAATLLIKEKLLALGLLVIFGLFVSCFIAPAAAITQDVVHPGLRAFSYGLCVILQHLLGDIWSPPLIGKLSDQIGIEKAVMFVPIYLVLGATFFFFASKYYERDLEKVVKINLEKE